MKKTTKEMQPKFVKLINMPMAKRYLWPLALVCLAVWSCSVSPVGEDVALPRPSEERISWASLMSDGPSTKGALAIDATGIRTGGIGILSYWTPQGRMFEGAGDQYVYLLNRLVEYDETVSDIDYWTCNPAAYWPLASTLTFFAYAPYMDADPCFTMPLSYSGMPRGRFTQKSSASDQVDLCLAAPSYDRSSHTGAVPLSFTHALTKVLVYVNIEGRRGDGLSYRVSSLSLNNLVGSNAFTYGSGLYGYTWDELPRSSAALRNTSYTETLAAGELSASALPHVDDLTTETGLDRFLCVNGAVEGQLLLLPQPMTTAATLSVTLTSYTVSGDVWTPVETSSPVVVRLPESTVWEAGRQVAYSLTVDVTSWQETRFGVTLDSWAADSKTVVLP